MAERFEILRAQMPRANQLRAVSRARAMLEEMPLQELRQARKLSQEALAAELETSQSNVSKLEGRVDVYVSTLRRYIEALGGELEIVARFPDGSVLINQFGDVDR